MIETLHITKAKCTICGSPTEWDESLKQEPLCMRCWDKQIQVENAAYQRRYRDQHKDDLLLGICHQKYAIERLNANCTPMTKNAKLIKDECYERK